jgi:5-methylcytosine-specific restriction endonuclease McrA
MKKETCNLCNQIHYKPCPCRPCVTCGKIFKPRGTVQRANAEYCSISCAKKGKIPPNLLIAQAASPINKKGYPSHLKGKKRHLSDEWLENTKKANCKRGRSKWQHWNWKGGVTPLNMLLRNRPEYREWRKAVYERDRWTCQDCGIHCDDKNIVAHHIMSFKDYPELRHEPQNGITFCRACHASLHQHLKESNGGYYHRQGVGEICFSK